MAHLCYDRATVTIPAKNVLYVINQKGTFTIQARDIEQLHSALAPYLSAGIEESVLLGSVGRKQRRIVEAYLQKLRDIQAVCSGLKEDNPTSGRTEWCPDVLGPGVRSGLATVGDQQVFVSLDSQGTVATCANIPCLLFVSCLQAGRLLLEWDNKHRTLVLVAVEDTTTIVSDAEIERRFGYANWLLHNNNIVTRQPALRVFVLQDDGIMVGSVSLDIRSSASFRVIPDCLKLVRPLDVDQVPLAVATLNHPFFPVVKNAASMHFKQASSYLLNYFAARLGSVGNRSFHLTKYAFTGSEKFIRVASTSDIDPVSLATCLVGGSSAELILSLLEIYVDGLRLSEPASSCNEIDLLADNYASPEIRYFIHVLRRRVRCLKATISRTEEGLFICTSGGQRTHSFARTKAIRDLLLKFVWNAFYEDKYSIQDVHLCCDYEGWIEQAELRQLMRDCAAHLAVRHGFPGLRLNAVKLWGNTIWTGTIEQ